MCIIYGRLWQVHSNKILNVNSYLPVSLDFVQSQPPFYLISLLNWPSINRYLDIINCNSWCHNKRTYFVERKLLKQNILNISWTIILKSRSDYIHIRIYRYVCYIYCKSTDIVIQGVTIFVDCLVHKKHFWNILIAQIKVKNLCTKYIKQHSKCKK